MKHNQWGIQHTNIFFILLTIHDLFSDKICSDFFVVAQLNNYHHVIHTRHRNATCREKKQRKKIVFISCIIRKLLCLLVFHKHKRRRKPTVFKKMRENKWFKEPTKGKNFSRLTAMYKWLFFSCLNGSDNIYGKWRKCMEKIVMHSREQRKKIVSRSVIHKFDV